jgi:hypothetical protein
MTWFLVIDYRKSQKASALRMHSQICKDDPSISMTKIGGELYAGLSGHGNQQSSRPGRLCLNRGT